MEDIIAATGAEHLPGALAEVARLRALQETPTEDCLWTEDEDGLWTASCDGRPWSTMDGSPPSDNSMRFCPKCGGSLSEKTHDVAALEACDED